MQLIQSGRLDARARRFRYIAMGAASVFGLAVTASALSPAPANAQDASAQASQPAPTQEVVVTGSRIARRDFVADSPIVTVNQQQLDTQAGATIGLKLQQLPQVTPSANELVGSGQPTGRATVDLRGLGANRTLVLADGRRLQPSTPENVVDLNTIPSALIDNIEVITGGASAVYGSDAVAGVVNLKLKHNFHGLELDGQFNTTDIGDGQEKTVSVLWGSNFNDNKGNVVFGASYLNRGAAYFRDREFYTKAFAVGAPPWGANQLPQGNYVPNGANLPSQAAVNALFASYGVASGTVANSNRFSFNSDGSLFSQFGGYHYTGPINSDYVLSTTTNSIAYNLGTLQMLTAPGDRYNIYSSGEYRFNDWITAYGQALFTKYTAVTNYGAGLQTQRTTATVPVDNPFIPADLATLLASRPDPAAPFSMEKLWTQTGTSVTTYDNTVYQLSGGFKGKLPAGDWTWDLYGSHGSTNIDLTQTSGGASYSRIQELLTSRSVAGAGGSLVHVPQYLTNSNGAGTLIPNPAYARATNDGGRSVIAADGTTPCPQGLNFFSDAPLTASCSAYLQIHPTNVTKLEQNVAELNLQGGLLDLPAGELRLALGGAYRENRYSFTPDPAGGDMVGSFLSQSASGATRVKELYGEALVPVLKDLPAIEAFNLDLGYRYSDYNQSGGVSTYKADFDWKVIDSVRLRGGYARAIRAPNVVELYNPAVAGPALLGTADPCDYNSSYRTGPNAAQITALCLAQGIPASIINSYKLTFLGTQAIQSGNTGLKPEQADTFTLGAVYRPSFSKPLLSRISASVDYYNIRLKDAISTLSADLAFSRCYGADYNPTFSASNPYCAAILRNTATGYPDETLTPYFNLGGIKTSGIDIELDWAFGLGAVGLSDDYGELAINSVVSYLLDFEAKATSDAAYADYTGSYGFNPNGSYTIGDNGAHPHWKANTTLTWSRAGNSLGFRWYYVGPMRDLVPTPTGGVHLLPSYSRFDLFGGLKINQSWSLEAGMNNIFDKQPIATFGGLPGNTDSGTYDPLGRRFYVSVRGRFD